MALTARDRAKIRFQHTEGFTACWVWDGSITHSGYGVSGAEPAHRYVYENIRGPIPDGVKLKRLCPRKACVNPNHYELRASDA